MSQTATYMGCNRRLMSSNPPRTFCHRTAVGGLSTTWSDSWYHSHTVQNKKTTKPMPTTTHQQALQTQATVSRILEFGLGYDLTFWFGLNSLPWGGQEMYSTAQGPRTGGAGGLQPLPPLLGNLVHTFDFLYERTHSRRRNAHKNVTFQDF